ncbi:MAG: SDR family NAD(P)-dependent oxidoreductase [Leptospirales bacterium]
MNLANKNFVITGGSKGIGKAIAMDLARLGANIALLARKKNDLQTAQKEIKKMYPNVKVSIFPTDISVHNQVKKTAKALKKEMGELDGLINNAGISYSETFENQPVKAFADTSAIKYLGNIYMTRECLPFIKNGGYISYTASVLAYMGLYGYTSYVGPNYAILGFAESLAQEVMERNIHVCVLCPPDTETPGYEKENKTKPYETMKISETAKLMSPEGVAKKFLIKMFKGKFFITVNFESIMLYRLSRLLPGFFRWYLKYTIRAIQKKKK